MRNLVLTHGQRRNAQAVAAGAQRYNSRVTTPQTRRSRDEVTRFFDGLDLVEPWCSRIGGGRTRTARRGRGVGRLGRRGPQAVTLSPGHR